jgi:hypothetical protein
MKKVLSYALAAGLLLNPFAAFAADYGSQLPQTNQAPPVAQPLVREGDFAIKLAAKLDLGLPTNEAVAEEMLAKVGVVPVNGWLSDYPVTPEIVGQLQDAIAKASADGKIPMTTSEATRGLYSLTAEMNLPTPAGAGGAPAEGPAGSTSPPEPSTSPAVINNYYYDEGPPVITYYPPPYDYYYLYAWVPYPVFWFGFWFPGFYICHNFTTVAVTHPFGPGDVGRRHIVTNRVIDPVTRRVAVVEPMTRTSAGAVRPVTILRTGSGRTFNTLAELRKETGGAAVNVGTRRSPANGMVGAQGFRSPEARKSAEAIYSRSVQGMRAGTVRGGSTIRGEGRRYISPGTATRRNTSPSSWGGARRYPNTAPPITQYRHSQRSYAGESVRPSYSAPIAPSTERSYSGPARHSFGSERQFVSPGIPSWSHSSAPLTRGGGSVRPFSGGWHWQGRGR